MSEMATDYSELKRLAEAATPMTKNAGDTPGKTNPIACIAGAILVTYWAGIGLYLLVLILSAVADDSARKIMEWMQ